MGQSKGVRCLSRYREPAQHGGSAWAEQTVWCSGERASPSLSPSVFQVPITTCHSPKVTGFSGWMSGRGLRSASGTWAGEGGPHQG